MSRGNLWGPLSFGGPGELGRRRQQQQHTQGTTASTPQPQKHSGAHGGTPTPSLLARALPRKLRPCLTLAGEAGNCDARRGLKWLSVLRHHSPGGQDLESPEPGAGRGASLHVGQALLRPACGGAGPALRQAACAFVAQVGPTTGEPGLSHQPCAAPARHGATDSGLPSPAGHPCPLKPRAGPAAPTGAPLRPRGHGQLPAPRPAPPATARCPHPPCTGRRRRGPAAEAGGRLGSARLGSAPPRRAAAGGSRSRSRRGAWPAAAAAAPRGCPAASLRRAEAGRRRGALHQPGYIAAPGLRGGVGNAEPAALPAPHVREEGREEAAPTGRAAGRDQPGTGPRRSPARPPRHARRSAPPPPPPGRRLPAGRRQLRDGRHVLPLPPASPGTRRGRGAEQPAAPRAGPTSPSPRF